MRVSILLLAWIFLSTPVYTQVLSLRVGMSEKELIKSAMPSRIEPGLTFEGRKGDIITFVQEDSAYTMTLFFTTKKGRIKSIRKRHVGSSVETRRILFYNFSENIKVLRGEPSMKENEKLASSLAREFVDMGVRAKAFSSKKLGQMKVYMFYNTKVSSVYIEIEGKM